jgi:hypothetical protein
MAKGQRREHRSGHDEVSTQGMSCQSRPHVGVRAGHDHGHPGPVPNVPACRREHLDRARLGTWEHGRQVADDASRPVGQSQLDRPVQILHDITESAGNLKDHDLKDGVCSDPYLRICSRAVGCKRSWEVRQEGRRKGRKLGRELGRQRADVVARACEPVIRIARLLHHGELDSVEDGAKAWP